MTSSNVSVSPIDLRSRVVALALEPALTLARIAALPLDDVQRLVSVGYFREARSRGMSFRTIARRFDKSLRTITNLSKRANEVGLPLEESERLSVRRQLVVRAGSEGTKGIARDALFDGLPNADRATLDDELEFLLGSGILETHEGRVRAAARHMDMVEESLGPRLESFRHFLRSVTLVTYRRFFVMEPEREAFARVLTFSADRDTLQSLRESAYENLRNGAFDADANASDEAGVAMATFCVVEESDDPAWRAPT
ncbi:MAG: hypothetical protein AAGE52_41310 [Myxococcota bacterium]